jgi:ser-asp rich fibrinogen/bone sialoprotein-binding protein sdrH
MTTEIQYDKEKNLYFFDFLIRINGESTGILLNQENYKTRDKWRIYIKPSYYFFDANDEKYNPLIKENDDARYYEFTDDDFNKMKEYIKSCDPSVSDISMIENDKEIHFYHPESHMDYVQYINVKVRYNDGTEKLSKIIYYRSETANVLNKHGVKEILINKDELNNLMLNKDNVKLVDKILEKFNENKVLNSKMSFIKNKIYFDFNAKKYYVEIRDKRNMFCSKDDTDCEPLTPGVPSPAISHGYGPTIIYLRLEDDAKINGDLEDVDLSKIDTVNVLHYNEDSFNPNDWKFDQIAINKNGCKVDGKSYFYLSENEYHDSDKKDVSKWLKSINEEYDISYFEEREQDGYKYWIFNMKNNDRLIFKLVPNKIPDAILFENILETRELTSEDEMIVKNVLYHYMKDQAENVKLGKQIVVDDNGKATLDIYIGKNSYSYDYDLNDPEYYTKKTIRVNKLENETFDIVNLPDIKDEKCESDPCDDCVIVKPGEPSPATPSDDSNPNPNPKPEKPNEKEKPKYKPMVTKPIPKKPKKEDTPVVQNEKPKEEEKATPSNLPKEKTSSSNLPKRNNENGVTGRVVSKNNNGNNIPNNNTPNNETKTNITIVNEKPIEDENKLKQNDYDNINKTNGLPNLDKEKREAVKTGDNLFSKITLFTAILSIFGLSYLPFFKKKKIETDSEN